MTIMIILFALVMLLAGVAMVLDLPRLGLWSSIALLVSFLTCIFYGCFMMLEQVEEPTALDVYRGKTTLEITYRDSIAIDSTVVYKKFDYGCR